MIVPQDRQRTLNVSARMPAEFEPHAATWLAWPHNHSDWPGKFSCVLWTYVEIIRWLQESEPVHILIESRRVQERAQALLERVRISLDNISFHLCPTDRSWLRDNGPTFVLTDSNELILLDWHFNAWARYKHWRKDNRVPQRMARILKLPCERVIWSGRRVVLEGGAIETNGCGTLLTTRQCLLQGPYWRNPGFTTEDYERLFAHYLGTRQVIWLEAGILGDDTQGHIDTLARFINPSTVAVAVETDSSSPNFEILNKNLFQLRGRRLANGKTIEIVELPLPRPSYYAHWRLPCSYLNFYISNRCVLVPTFNDPNDRIALNTLAQFFPDREVIGIHSLDLAVGLGTIHCITLQQPALP